MDPSNFQNKLPRPVIFQLKTLRALHPGSVGGESSFRHTHPFLFSGVVGWDLAVLRGGYRRTPSSILLKTTVVLAFLATRAATVWDRQLVEAPSMNLVSQDSEVGWFY